MLAPEALVIVNGLLEPGDAEEPGDFGAFSRPARPREM